MRPFLGGLVLGGMIATASFALLYAAQGNALYFLSEFGACALLGAVYASMFRDQPTAYVTRDHWGRTS